MIKKMFLAAAFLCAGCPPSPGRSEPEPIMQPGDSVYKLDTIDAFYGGQQTKTAQWINAHPKAEIVSMLASQGNGIILVVYKEKP